MNVKYDDRKPARPRTYTPPPYPPTPYQLPPHPYYAPPRPYYPPAPAPPTGSSVGASEPQQGQKPCNVLVRELWIGGIP